MAIKDITNAVRETIKRKSAYGLPRNPSEAGYSADEIRDALWKPVCDEGGSLLAELERVIREANEELSGRIEKIRFDAETKSIVYTVGGEDISIGIEELLLAVNEAIEKNEGDIAELSEVVAGHERKHITAEGERAEIRADIEALEDRDEAQGEEINALGVDIAKLVNDIVGLVAALERVEGIAKGAQRGKSYNTYEELIADLVLDNEPSKVRFSIGQNFYIQNVGVPDLWVCGVFDADDTDTWENGFNHHAKECFEDYNPDGNYLGDERFVEVLSYYNPPNSDPQYNGMIVGPYLVSPLETGKVNLDNHPTFEEMAFAIMAYVSEQHNVDGAAHSDIREQIGDIDTALDNIIAIQNSLIGGDAE